MSLFTGPALDKAVNDALAPVADEHNMAALRFTRADGVTAVFAQRIGDHWAVKEVINKPPDAALNYGVEIHGTWRW